MFEKLSANMRKRRRRKGMRPRRSTRGVSRRRTLRLGPVVKIAGIVIGVLGLAAIIIFVVVPLFGGEKEAEEMVAEVSSTPAPTASPIAKDDMSGAALELPISYKSISDPYVGGSEVVFATDPDSSAQLSKIGIYDIATDQTALVDTIEKNYFSLFEPMINEDFIVYLDCKTEFGGAVCGYDRAKDEMFVMREYLYGKPQIALVGNYALWMQQTGGNTDKLYLFNLETQENTLIEAFRNPMTFIGAADMCEDALIFVQPYRQNDVVGFGTSSSSNNELCVIPLKVGGDNERVVYYPGMFVYEPKIDGDYIVFLDGAGDENSNLMVCEKQGSTYSTPKAIATGVMNYDVGDGYVAYTLEDIVYIYYLTDDSSGKLSSETTRARLSSANGKNVVWYDVTGGLDTETDVIMHIVVP